jgi:DNA-binding NarL/FixJ family response regulator
MLKNLFNQGIDGYILANEPEVKLTKLISVLTFDAAPISSKVIKILTKNQESFCPANVKLTNRESDVYELLSKGLPNKSIASQLGLSIYTVADYVKSIFKKMKIHNRSELIILRHNTN